MAKVTKVTLVVPLHDMEMDFTIPEAEALLTMPNNGGWQLPENSEFTFKDGIISRRSKGEGKGKEGKCDKE